MSPEQQATSLAEKGGKTLNPEGRRKEVAGRFKGLLQWLKAEAFMLWPSLLLSLPLLLWYASPSRSAWSVVLGLLSVAGASLSFIVRYRSRLPREIAGSAEAIESIDSAETVTSKSDLLSFDFLRSAALWVFFLFATVLSLRAAVHGSGLFTHRLMSSLTVTISFSGVLIGLTHLLSKLNLLSIDTKKVWWRREGLWLLLLWTLIALPWLGNFGLYDPWETHYGEVAREMLAKDDWISLWWAQDGWFFSKPILNFWLQGLGFSLFGVQYQPDQMLLGFSQGAIPRPEWGARFPQFLLTAICLYFFYVGLRHAFNRRVAFLAGLVTATTPYWYLLAHQTMADMPYVAPLIAAMGFALLAKSHSAEEQIATHHGQFGRFKFSYSLADLLGFFVALLSLPQIVYLASRNVRISRDGLKLPFDYFTSGSGMGNCGLPGNSACYNMKPLFPLLQPVLMGALWLVILLWALRSILKERRLKQLAYIACWLFTALAVMAKGAPGLVLPLAAIIAGLVLCLDFAEFRHLRWRHLGALLACVAAPWFIQMYLRHGPQFFERLFVHDMIKRAFVHVHDTNEGDDVSFRYYVWQLGYGLFPWTGIAFIGFFAWLRNFRKNPSGEALSLAGNPSLQGALLLFAWAVSAFGMFTITLTKFHHYIFPLVPAIAALSALALNGIIRSAESSSTLSLSVEDDSTKTLTAEDNTAENEFSLSALLTVLGAAALSWAAIEWWPGSYSGHKSLDTLHLIRHRWALSFLFLSAILFGLAYWLPRHADKKNHTLSADKKPALPFELSTSNLLIFLGGLTVLIAVCGDLVNSHHGKVHGSARLLHLFTYNYKRPWPEHLHFDGVFFPLTIAMGVSTLFYLGKRPGLGVYLSCGVALCSAIWGANIYMDSVAPHLDQRSTIQIYYQQRKNADEALIAYQMNWKGENFYTSNHLPVFVSTGRPFKEYIGKELKAGKRTFFFTTEHGRIGSLRRELPEPFELEKLSDAELNNKFFLAKVSFNEKVLPNLEEYMKPHRTR